MRHRDRGRTLGRNASHRKAMFKNMAASLILTLRDAEDEPNKPAVPGRITTTLAKAKEFRPFIERLITLARRSLEHETNAAAFQTTANRNTPEWKAWRESDQWQKWNQAIAPAVAYRRRAFALLRDKTAVTILFDQLAKQFEDRNGGYTRILKLTTVRLGDAGPTAMIEFVGRNDRVKTRKPKAAAPIAVEEEIRAAAAEPSSPSTGE